MSCSGHPACASSRATRSFEPWSPVSRSNARSAACIDRIPDAHEGRPDRQLDPGDGACHLSKKCIDLLGSGVELEALVPWLSQQILGDLSAAAGASFLNVDGLTTATQVHEWVDAQQPEDDR